MSQVLESHVLRVGQTVCISSPEESKSLHPAGYPGCSALPGKYIYYSTDTWADPPSVLHPKAHLHPSARATGAQPVPEQGKGHKSPSLERAPAPCRPQEEENPGVDPEAQPMSPSLDITIETLNQLILEIDPTFQPLPCRPVKDPAQPSAQGDTEATKKKDLEAIGEAKVELPSGGNLSQNLGQRGRAHTWSHTRSCAPGDAGNGYQGHSPLSPVGSAWGTRFLTVFPDIRSIKEQDRLPIQALPDSSASMALV